MFFERNLSGIDVILRIENYQSPSKHEFGDWWCNCSFSFRMGDLAQTINHRVVHDELLTPEEIDDLAFAFTDLLDGRMTEPREIFMLEPFFAFMLYPIKDLRKAPEYTHIAPGFEYQDIYVEWRVFFWNDGAPTDNYLNVTLYREDIVALRDYLNSVRKDKTYF